MKLKGYSLGLACLNVVLVMWIVVLLCTRPAPQGGVATSIASPGPAAQSAPRMGDKSIRSGSGDETPDRRFDWRQVESEDYTRYLANLRAIGCPEKTIRDIIVADVNDLFASKVASLTKTNEYQYWKKEPVSRSEEQVKQLRDLYAQKRDLLKALGVDAPDFTDLLGEAYRDNIEERMLQLAFLPESKRRAVTETLFEQARQEIAEGNNVARRDVIEQQAQARIQSLLTPEEFKEYELRSSTDALQLRGTLEVVRLTEQEFRLVFDSWRSLKALRPGTEEYRTAQQESETALQQLLGPDRFQSYLWGVKLLGYAN